MKTSVDQIVKLTADYCGYPQNVTKEILLGYAQVVRKLLLSGHRAKLPDLGTFMLKICNARPQREMVLPSSGERVIVDAKPAYQKPIFRFYPSFNEQIREETEDNLK